MEQKMKTQGSSTAIIVGVLAVVALIGVYLFSQTDDSMMDEEMMDDQEMMDNESMNNEEDMMDDGDMEDGVEVGGAMMVPSKDIVENAMEADNVTTVVAAVSAAGLVDTLKSDGPFTVFAPNNAAFDALPAGTVDTLLEPENQEQLTTILTYHVVAGAYTSADLEDGQTLTTVQGDDITIGKSGNTITVNGSAMVETADVISSNGVTFVIDEVLMPAESGESEED